MSKKALKKSKKLQQVKSLKTIAARTSGSAGAGAGATSMPTGGSAGFGMGSAGSS